MIQGEATTKDNSSIIIEGFQSDKLKNSTSPQKLAKEDNNDFNWLDKDKLNEENEEASKLNNLLGKKRNFIENVKQIENFKNDEMQLKKENPLDTRSDNPKEIKESEYKLESLLKVIWSEFLDIIKDNLNKKLQKCNSFKTKAFKKSNYKLNQGNPTILNGKKMLKKNIIDIFCDFEIKRPNDINDKKHNKDLKEAIYSKKDFPSTQEEIELKNYCEMNIIEAIKEIYNDEPFKLQCLREKYKDWDEKFKNEKKKKKGFYLLYEYGLIKYY